jgi:protein phosphatase
VRQEQIDSGLEPKPGHENIITRFLGGKQANPEIVDGIGRVFYNDVYVLCTDGVWGVLEDNDFEDILSQDCKTEEACQALIDFALQKGSTDNLSAIIVRRVK